MKRMRHRIVLALPLVFVAAALLPLSAQSPATHPMSLDDILSFRALSTNSLSPDGKWFAYRVSPLEGDSEVTVRSTTGGQEWKFEVGEGGTPMTFSDDSMWLAISTAMTKKEADAARKAQRPVQNSVTIVNLTNGEQVVVPKVRRFAFSGEMAGWIAMHRYGADAAGGGAAAGGRGGRGGGRGGGGGAANTPRSTSPRGNDLILRELKTGTELNVGNVSEFEFNKSGKFLALVIDAADQAGNGLQIRDMSSGVITSLETGKAFYERMSWTDEGDALAMLKGTDDRQYRERLFSVVGFTGFGSGTPKRVVYDPKEDTTFPAEMSVSGSRTPTWTEDRAALIFGINDLTKAPRPAGRGGRGGAADEAGSDEAPAGRGAGAAPDAADRPNLVVWHYKDPRLQTQQQVQANSDRNFNYVTMFRPGENKMIRIADEEVPDIQISGRGRWAIGTSDLAYELMGNLNGQRFRDIYAIDTTTGRKTVIKKNLRWANSASPDTTKYLYYENKHYFVFDTATGTAHNITEKVRTSFVDVEDDHNVVDPPARVLGWSADNNYVLLSDLWDIWKVPVAAGESAVNLTVNGKKDQIRYQNRLRIDPDEQGIDLSKPQYFSAMAEWTKRAGYGLLEPGKVGLNMLLWEEAAISGLQKAEKGTTWLYRKETSTQAPQIFVTDATLTAGRMIVDMAPEAESLAWSSGARLIDFKNDKGERLQASLYLPANYEEGKQYPTLVYIYERLTQGHYQYGRPTANGFNRQAYTSNGYAVLQPDIKYYINDPGMSAAWTLPAAVKAAVATGIVDPKRVGLHGHSWGGYQTAFSITQSDTFAAAVAGAPLTDMISMYSIVYKNSGGTNGAIFESSQGRFTSGPWDNWEAYTRNSPVAFAKNVKTPLVILHNDQDGAVDFTQGIEYFNTLRRLDKPVVLLEYPGENHGLARPANQQDYTVRMKEFFDHFLKDAPAPDWWKNGVPSLEMDEHIDGRLKAREEAKKNAAGGGGGGGR